MVDATKPIRRSPRGAMLGGVCAGIAAWAGWDPSVVRVAYVLATAFSGFLLGLAAYAALWALLPAAE
ncbi:MAG TPA: PspC domain-containing protein [Vicinamibacteria bacterium]|jgi:phage shock protein PspC (stress-responsive transcriptional regulator)